MKISSLFALKCMLFKAINHSIFNGIVICRNRRKWDPDAGVFVASEFKGR
jgi:hypothetical protein